MDTPEVIQSSEIKSTSGRYPSQIVLRLVKPKTYATHIKVLPPDAEPYFILGHYFFSREDAEADFKKRVQEVEGLQGEENG